MAMFHMMSFTSNMDANFKLLRRQELMAQAEIQSHLKQAAFQLPLDQEKNYLFGQGLAEVYALNES